MIAECGLQIADCGSPWTRESAIRNPTSAKEMEMEIRMEADTYALIGRTSNTDVKNQKCSMEER